MSGLPFTRALATLFVEELARHRALAPSLARAAVALRVRAPDGSWSACTALLDDPPRVLDGEVLPPGLPAATLSGDEEALRELLAGRADARALAASGRLSLQGPPELLAALAACFPAARSPLSVRFTR